MQTASLGRAQSLASFKGGSRGSRAAGRRQVAPVVRAAAAAATEDVNLGSLFRDALATPAAEEAKKAVVEAAPVTTSTITLDSVPGTEILSSGPVVDVAAALPPPPPPVPAPTQGMDLVLQQLASKPPGYGDNTSAAASTAAKAAAKPLTEGLGDGLATAGKGLGGGFASAGKGLGDAGAAAGQGLADAGAVASKELTSAVDSVTGAAGAVTSSVAGTVSGAAGAVTSTVTDAAGAVSSKLGGAASGAADVAGAAAAAATAAADQLAGQLQGAAGGVVGASQQFVGAAADEFNTEFGIMKANVDSLVGGVQSAVGGTTSAVTSQVSSQVAGVTEQVSALLPPQAQEALSAVGGAVSNLAQQLAGLDSTTGAAVAGVGLGLPALLAWKAVYGGFAGTLQPEEALEVLQTQDALLLDIRPEAQRVQKGVAELRRGALGKGVAVPPVQLGSSLSRRVRDPAGVALEIHALEIAALGKVDPAVTKVIIMADGQGGQAKTLARALRSVGVRRPYVLQGGFRAWTAAGLGVRQGSSEYDASPLDAVGDVAETVAAAAAGRLSQLQEPRNAATAAAAVGGLGFVALNFHTALQFLGVLGLELTLVSRALSYSSPQDALDDLAGLYNSAASLASLPAKAVAAVSRGARAAAPRQQAAAGESDS